MVHGEQERMEKSITAAEYRVFLELLQGKRQAAGLTQVEVAERIGETQSFVSKIERGELRLDFLQLRTFCLALDTNLASVAKEFEKVLRSTQ